MREEIDLIDFGKWMQRKRKEMNVTQERFGRMVMSNKNTISRYESGDRFPPLDVAERIVSVLGAELVIREKNR